MTTHTLTLTAPTPCRDNPAQFEDDPLLHAGAKALCLECDQRAKCLDFALRTGVPTAVWGGLTPTERRRRIGRERQANSAQAAELSASKRRRFGGWADVPEDQTTGRHARLERQESESA